MQAEVCDSMGRGHSWGELAVRTIVGKLWPGATIYPCEKDAHPVAQLLDTSCGIDWLVVKGGIVKGISVRAQKRKYASWQTFTIRDKRKTGASVADSELAKGLRAGESIAAVSAAYQLHAYVDVDEGPASSLVCWAIARRPELLRWIADNRDTLPQNEAEDIRRGQIQTFYYPGFLDLPDSTLVAYKLSEGDKVHIVGNEQPAIDELLPSVTQEEMYPDYYANFFDDEVSR